MWPDTSQNQTTLIKAVTAAQQYSQFSLESVHLNILHQMSSNLYFSELFSITIRSFHSSWSEKSITHQSPFVCARAAYWSVIFLCHYPAQFPVIFTKKFIKQNHVKYQSKTWDWISSNWWGFLFVNTKLGMETSWLALWQVGPKQAAKSLRWFQALGQVKPLSTSDFMWGIGFIHWGVVSREDWVSPLDPLKTVKESMTLTLMARMSEHTERILWEALNTLCRQMTAVFGYFMVRLY